VRIGGDGVGRSSTIQLARPQGVREVVVPRYMRPHLPSPVAVLASLTVVLAGALAPNAEAAVLPFAPTSVWNAPLSNTAPLASNSSALVTELQRQVTTYGTWINTWQYSAPVYTVPSTQPRVHVTLDTNAPTLQAAFNSVPVPPTAVPALGSDRHLVVWQPSTDSMWEFWKMQLLSDGWHARWGGAMASVSSNPGYFPAPYGATGTSLPLLGGLMRISELQAGQLNHALALAIPQTKASTFVFPAQRSDGNYSGSNAIPEGTRFRISPAVDVTKLGLPPVGLMIAQAAQRYGIVVRDQAGAVVFYGEDPTQYGSPNPYGALFGGQYPNNILAKFPWGSLQVVAPGP
jgi:hypothetical protein